MGLQRPADSEYASFYKKYVALIPDVNILDYLENQRTATLSFFNSIDQDKLDLRYEPGKWSIKEIFGHVIDTERIFAYRALCIGRGDTISFPGFDQDKYVEAAGTAHRKRSEIAKEFDTLRIANLSLFRGFTDEIWDRRGIASENELTVRSVPYIIAGHLQHHIRIINERYLGV